MPILPFQRVLPQVRAGTGGGEAALWAADLLRMYSRYAAEQRWKVDFLNSNEAESGGYKEAVIQVSCSTVLTALALACDFCPTGAYLLCTSTTGQAQNDC